MTCESCERLTRENDQLRDAVTIWQKLADERKEQIAAQSERLIALSETQAPIKLLADIKYEIQRVMMGARWERESFHRLLERINQELPDPDITGHHEAKYP